MRIGDGPLCPCGGGDFFFSFQSSERKLFCSQQDAFRPSARNFSAFSKKPPCSPRETAPKKYPTILCNVSKDKLPSIQYYFAKYPCFGEHLLTDKTTTKTIATVVSEKTAIIATHFISDFVWLATGGMNGCFNKDAVEVLSGREVVLVPDLGATDKWKSKLPLLQSIPQFGITECLIQYKCSVHTLPSHAIRSG